MCTFIALGNSNYANATELFMLQHESWEAREHPALDMLKRHFKACSEEKGEMSIGVMGQHLRDSNYSGSNMAARYLESAVSDSVFEFIDVHKSHKGSTLKTYFIERQLWDPKFYLIEDELKKVEAEIDYAVFAPKKKMAKIYNMNSPCDHNLAPWLQLHSQLENMKTAGENHIASIDSSTLFESLELKENESVDLDNIFW